MFQLFSLGGAAEFTGGEGVSAAERVHLVRTDVVSRAELGERAVPALEVVVCVAWMGFILSIYAAIHFSVPIATAV